MRWNFKRELARKFVHLLSVLILFIYYFVGNYFNEKIALLVLVFILIVFIELEYLRVEVRSKVPILKGIWKYVRRKKEKDRFGGDVFFLVGAILVLAIFDFRVAMAAILMTTFGDMSAALIGSRFGKNYLVSLKDRAWEGIFAEFGVDLVIGFFVFFWGFFNDFSILLNLNLWIVVIVMAVTATFVETIIYKLDDNLVIPIFAGFNGQIALMLLGLV
ncbi:MAG: CTP--2,3-di-O-geranylgeranyl-sn-glycero-1-phosphate cytidyltransferase [archaeon]